MLELLGLDELGAFHTALDVWVETYAPEEAGAPVSELLALVGSETPAGDLGCEDLVARGGLVAVVVARLVESVGGLECSAEEFAELLFERA